MATPPTPYQLCNTKFNCVYPSVHVHALKRLQICKQQRGTMQGFTAKGLSFRVAGIAVACAIFVCILFPLRFPYLLSFYTGAASQPGEIMCMQRKRIVR